MGNITTAKEIQTASIRAMIGQISGLDVEIPEVVLPVIAAEAVMHELAERLLAVDSEDRWEVLQAICDLTSPPSILAVVPSDLGICGWFLLCDRPATHLEPHPMLGPIPACDRCPTIGAPRT